jgi:hypothetical protein
MEATLRGGPFAFSIEKDGKDRVPLLYNFILYIYFCMLYIFIFILSFIISLFNLNTYPIIIPEGLLLQ